MKLYQLKYNLLNQKLKFIKFIKFFLNTKKSKKLLEKNKIVIITSPFISKTDIKHIFYFFLPQYNIKYINTNILKKKKKIYLTFK